MPKLCLNVTEDKGLQDVIRTLPLAFNPVLLLCKIVKQSMLGYYRFCVIGYEVESLRWQEHRKGPVFRLVESWKGSLI